MTMLGQRVSGYEVSSILGEGQHGTLYLAVNPDTGHRAAVRVLSPSDTGAAFSPFAREVADALKLSRIPEVENRTLDDGRSVLLARVDAAAPGTGATRFAETTRLERRPASKKRRWLPALMLLLALLLLVLGWWRRQPQPLDAEPSASPAVLEAITPPVLAPTPEKQANALEPSEHSPRLAEALAPLPTRAPAAVVAPTPRVVTRTERIEVTPPPPCLVGGTWKNNRLSDLAELQERVTPSEQLSKQLQPQLDQLSVRIRDARDGAECAAVEAALTSLATRTLPR